MCDCQLHIGVEYCFDWDFFEGNKYYKNILQSNFWYILVYVATYFTEMPKNPPQ